MQTDLLRIAIAGSVDDGKSTLLGRLLYDSKQLLEDQLAAVERTSRQRGDTYVNLALLTDGLRAEREQGITIDVAYRYFATARRKFIVADTPGHQQYTRNMVTGASTADLAIILVDARLGVLEQSRRHAFLASLLGISHVLVCVNKMDLVGFEQEAFRRTEEEFASFASKLAISDVTFIPVSALNGDNVVERSTAMPWYQGPPVLYYLEHVHVASDRNLIDFRFPVQWVNRPIDAAYHDYRGYSGQVASGVIRTGDDVVVLPSMAHSRVKKIDTFEGGVEQAFPPMSVTILLEDDIDISRGDMICRPNNLPNVGSDFEALLCWMDDRPLVLGKDYILRQTTRSTRVRVEEIQHRVEIKTLARDEGVTSLAMNEIGRVRLRSNAPLFFDEYKKNRETGSIILIDESTNATAAGGMLLEAYVAPQVSMPPRASAPPPRSAVPSSPLAIRAPRTSIPPPAIAQASELPKSPNVFHTRGTLTREMRAISTKMRGATVWLTGLSGSGKSTIGAALEQTLVLAGRPAYLLDGDNLRHGLCGDLGFSAEDRAENVRRVSHVAHLLADVGVVSIVTLISPYASDRARARALADGEGLPFIEVYVATPLDECERRDPKGLYKRARAGELKGFTGVDEPYEPPPSPEVVTRGASTVEAVEQIVAALQRCERARE